jgi:HK97 family phage major capsid protein
MTPMSEVLLARFVQERESLSEHISATLGKAEAQERDLVEAEIKALQETEKRMSEVDEQIGTLKKAMESRNSVFDVQHLLAKQAVAEKRETAQFQVSEPAPSLGSFVDSQAYRDWDGHGRSGKFTLGSTPSGMLTRATLKESAPIGSYLLPNNQKFVLPQGDFGFPLLDAVGRLQITGSSVDLVTYGEPRGATGFAVVPELGAKPEATMKATTVTHSVETVAAWAKASRQLLADAPAARGFIEDQLRRGFRAKVEADITAAITAATVTATTGTSGQSLLEVARVGMATVASTGFTPNALLVNPASAAAFDLAMYKSTLGGAALGVGVWGLQVIPVNGLTKSYVGDFRTGVTLIERSGVDVFITDSDQDDFIHNILTVLAEGRYKAVVTNAAAITELKVTP